METIIKADIFFFVSSIGFILLFVLAAIVLVQFIFLLRRWQRMSKKLEQDADTIREDAKEFLEHLTESRVFRFIFGKKRSIHTSKHTKK
jgi:hypothetical protein